VKREPSSTKAITNPAEPKNTGGSIWAVSRFQSDFGPIFEPGLSNRAMAGSLSETLTPLSTRRASPRSKKTAETAGVVLL
jgi:hypothetical protein